LAADSNGGDELVESLGGAGPVVERVPCEDLRPGRTMTTLLLRAGTGAAIEGYRHRMSP
jgi:hypothetical protein